MCGFSEKIFWIRTVAAGNFLWLHTFKEKEKDLPHPTIFKKQLRSSLLGYSRNKYRNKSENWKNSKELTLFEEKVSKIEFYRFLETQEPTVPL